MKKLKRTYYYCINCQKEAYFNNSQKKYYPTIGKFCSLSCKKEYYRKHPENHPCFNGGKYKDSFGYVVIKYTDSEGHRKRTREHRRVMELYLKRKLKKDEHVHHLNGIKDDNRIENLTVLTSSNHHKKEWEENKEKYLKINREKVFPKTKEYWTNWRMDNWSKKHSKCVVCNSKEYRHQAKGKCTRCYLKEYQQSSGMKI